ncbi:putative ABC transport system permease protein [Catalinimonas alkaloidigena]|uniref:FtsX-like permease family protein n=1 Tax=Catalinimonas alkaloidigena TaxID=1075417 RepID=UPI002404BD17|nr:FtsX-like permease family protein [Catalinimonas alkaloidigena]MDF9800166.1 putative ABC transport system permease protein [Catalinimonas alkaloidigena]
MSNIQKYQPPQRAQQFLRWFCDPDLLPEIEGDLHESYLDWVSEDGDRRANFRYWMNVLTFFRPYFIAKRQFSQPANSSAMFKNYFKVAYRNLLKQKLYSIINISGLMVSFTFCILIWLYVQDELSFDRSYTYADQIYRAWVLEDYGPDEIFFNTHTPMPLGPALDSNFSEVKATVRVGKISSLVKKGEDSQNEEVFYADPQFFKLFNNEVLSGDVSLSQLQDLVLTESHAVKYFGDADPIGQSLSIKLGDQYQEFSISAVVADLPSNVSLQYNMLIPYDNNKAFSGERSRASWYNVSVETYALLDEQTNAQALEGKLDAMVKQVLGENYKPGEYTVGLQPLTDIRLNTDFPKGGVAVSDWKYVYILSAVALLILVVACINFVTLAVGRSLSRAKEVGVRKVIGAVRRQLMSQFWSEAFMTTFIATGLGILLVVLLLPYFNQLADKALVFSFSMQNILFLFLLTVVVGFLAGVYPALILSGFSPLMILRGSMSMGYSRETLRKIMVSFQFVLAAILIIGTLVMKQQMTYLQNKNLGFDKEQIIVIPQNMQTRMSGSTMDQFMKENFQRKQLIKNALDRLPEVKEVTTSFFTFGQSGWIEVGFTTEEGTYREFNMNTVDQDFVKTYGLEMLQGRDFDVESGADARSGVLINKTFARAFNLGEAVGSTLPPPFQEYQVVGVLSDFHYQSLHAAIEPALLVMNPYGIFKGSENVMFEANATPKISVKVQSEALAEMVDELKEVWKEVAPEQQFEFSFVDERLDAQYRAEQRLSTILNVTTALGIFISCLGLFGLVTLSMNKKTKEIGIRKVLGASVWQVMALSYKEFMLLIALAFLVAVPVSYLMMKRWLADFAYQIDLGAPIFLLAGGIIVLIASLTIAYQSMKAAKANPVDSLRSE